MKSIPLQWLTATMIIIVFTISCKKIEVDQGFTAFGQIYFNADQAAGYQAGYLKLKYNGHPVDMQGGTGRSIRVPAGEAKFEFYDDRTGEVLLEETVNIVPGNPERYTLFQPTMDAPLSFLDENAQAGEEAAPEGYYKVKFVDYTGNLFSFNKGMDIVLWRAEFSWITFQTEYVEIGVLENISSNLDEEDYHLIPVESGDIGLAFSFREAETGSQLITVAGKEFLNTQFYEGLTTASIGLSNPKKNVFTAYIEAYAIDYQNDNFVKIGDKLYGIQPVIFLKN